MHTICAVVIVIKQVPTIKSCFLSSHSVFHPYYTLPQGWLGVSLCWTLVFNALFTDFDISNNLLWLMLNLEPLTSGLRTIPSGIFISLTELKSLLPVSGSICLLYCSILSAPSLISNPTTCLWIYLLYYTILYPPPQSPVGLQQTPPDSTGLQWTHLFWERWTHFQLESGGFHQTPPDFSPPESTRVHWTPTEFDCFWERKNNF